jgi:hypothetical protein
MPSGYWDADEGCRALRDSMAGLPYQVWLARALVSRIIATLHFPSDHDYHR